MSGDGNRLREVFQLFLYINGVGVSLQNEVLPQITIVLLERVML